MTLRGQFFAASVLAIVEEILKLVLAAIFLYKNPTVECALLAVILGNLAIILYSVLRYKFYVKDFVEFRIRDCRFIYSYGLRSFWLNLSNLSNAHMGTLVLSGLMTNSQLGIYNLAFGLIARLQVLPDALNRVLVPASIANTDKDRRFRMIQISVTGLLAFSLLVVPVLGMFNKPIMTFLFGIEYREAGPIALFLFIGFAFKLIGKPLEAHFNEIVGNPTIIAGIHVFSITMMALLTYFGAVQFGLAGAAIGSSTAMILGAVALLIAYTRSTGYQFASLVSARALIVRLRQIRHGKQ